MGEREKKEKALPKRRKTERKRQWCELMREGKKDRNRERQSREKSKDDIANYKVKTKQDINFRL